MKDQPFLNPNQFKFIQNFVHKNSTKKVKPPKIHLQKIIQKHKKKTLQTRGKEKPFRVSRYFLVDWQNY